MNFLRVRRRRQVGVSRGMDGGHGATTNAAVWTGDDYNQRLIKLIPAEALFLFPFGLSVIPDGQAIWELTWFAVCLAFTVTFRFMHTKDSQGRPQWAAMFISAVSFVVWVVMWQDGIGPYMVPPEMSFVPLLAGVAWVSFSTLLFRGDLLEADA